MSDFSPEWNQEAVIQLRCQVRNREDGFDEVQARAREQFNAFLVDLKRFLPPECRVEFSFLLGVPEKKE